MTDSIIPDVPAFADALSPLERAKLGLQDELSVFEIGLLTYPNKEADKERRRLIDFLLQAIRTGRLAAYGNPDGWTFNEMVPVDGGAAQRGNNPFPEGRPHQGTRTAGRMGPPQCIGEAFGLHRLTEQWWEGDNCLVRRADYLAIHTTPAARGIPAPDWWQAPQGKPAPLPQGENAPAGSRDNLRLSNGNYRLSPLQGEPDRPERGKAAERMRAPADVERLIHERAEDPAGLAFYWLPFCPEWSLLDSAFLLFGRDPDLFKGKEAPRCVDKLYRAMRLNRLPDPIRPVDVARWFQEQFGAYYDLPPGLAALLAESPASEPDQPESGAAVNKTEKPESGAAAKRTALAQLLDELDKRAVEQGAGFDRHSLPGTKDEFARLLQIHCPAFRYIGIGQIDAYLNGKCQFQRGAKSKQRKGVAIWALFPEYDLK